MKASLVKAARAHPGGEGLKRRDVTFADGKVASGNRSVDLAKAAGLSTLLSVGAELAVDNDDRLIQAIRNGGEDTINDAGQQIVRRQLNIAPTLTIRPGFPVRVIVTRDLVLEPYGGS